MFVFIEYFKIYFLLKTLILRPLVAATPPRYGPACLIIVVPDPVPFLTGGACCFQVGLATGDLQGQDCCGKCN